MQKSKATHRDETKNTTSEVLIHLNKSLTIDQVSAKKCGGNLPV